MARTTRFAAGDLADTPDGRCSIIGLTTDRDGLPAYQVSLVPDGRHATYSEWEMTPLPEGECLGIEIPEVSDEVAVWIDANGTMTNRLKHRSGLERESALVDKWIDSWAAISKATGGAA